MAFPVRLHFSRQYSECRASVPTQQGVLDLLSIFQADEVVSGFLKHHHLLKPHETSTAVQTSIKNCFDVEVHSDPPANKPFSPLLPRRFDCRPLNPILLEPVVLTAFRQEKTERRTWSDARVLVRTVRFRFRGTLLARAQNLKRRNLQEDVLDILRTKCFLIAP